MRSPATESKLESGMTVLDIYMRLKTYPSSIPELQDQFGLVAGTIRWHIQKLMYRDMIYVCCMLKNKHGPAIKIYTVNQYFPKRGNREKLSNCYCDLTEFQKLRNEYSSAANLATTAPNIYFRSSGTAYC